MDSLIRRGAVTSWSAPKPRFYRIALQGRAKMDLSDREGT